jgi:hypothetical protein
VRSPEYRIRCFVRGCEHFLRPPARHRAGDLCPEHHIRTHSSRTYSYADVRRNAIVARDLLADRIVGNPHKFESHRLGLEKSEDMATFNLFRSFQEAGCLNYIGRYVTGLEVEAEPRLYLWGLEMTDDSLRPWDLLQAARERFERSLPVKRPLTEPDAALFLDRHYLLLCEVKLTSPNTHYVAGPRRDEQSLTKDELLSIYRDLLCPMLDVQRAREADAVAYQLWRNTVFAQWMAAHASPGTRPFFANLVRRGCEVESFNQFVHLVRPEFVGQVCRVSWEDIGLLAGLAGGRLTTLREYLLTKTANLLPAFDFRL